MSKQINGRVAILGLSGLMLAVSAGSWSLHNQQNLEREATAAAAKTELVALQATALESVASQTAPVTVVTPASKRSDIVKVSRANAGRPDPMSSAGQRSHFVRPLIASSQDFSHVYHRSQRKQQRSYGFVPPPPPGYGTVYAANMMSAYQPPTVTYSTLPVRHETLAENCALIGIMDNKAIFRIAPSFARARSLPSSFMIGKGETFETVELESVSKESATIRQGNVLSVKELGPIR